MEQTDQELTFQRRTIPPLPQLTNGAPSSPPPWEQEKEDLGYSEKELDKEREAEEEFQQELKSMVRPTWYPLLVCIVQWNLSTLDYLNYADTVLVLTYVSFN